VVKNLPANAGATGDMGTILDQEDPLEEEMTIHSNILAWKTPWTEEPGGLQSMGTQRDGMGREEGGGFRMGNTCIPVADSF